MVQRQEKSNRNSPTATNLSPKTSPGKRSRLYPSDFQKTSDFGFAQMFRLGAVLCIGMLGTIHPSRCLATFAPQDGTSQQIENSQTRKDTESERETPAIPDLPRPITSFGAARIGDVVYAYGGNIDTPHEYYKGCQSGQLLKLDTGKAKGKWEVIAEDDQLQGVVLVAHDRFLYRIGGFTATNAKGEPQSLHSVDDFKRFDPTNGKWEALPSLPAGRSSLDAFVDGETLYVIGGWDMNGDEDTVWHTDALVCDLSKEKLEWNTIGKPDFERRAMAIAMHGDQLLVAGGMSSDEETLTDVSLYDPESETWTNGPNLPGKSLHGFGAAAATVDGQAVVSMMNGETYRLDKDGKSWTKVSESDSPRFFHRLIPFGNRVMAIGGTSMETGKYDTCEWIEIGSDR